MRHHPITSANLVMLPMDIDDAREFYDAVDSCREYLEPWLPWVPFQTDVGASIRFAQYCTNDWDAERALRWVIRERRSKRLIGVVSLETIIHLHLSCDLGYWIHREVNGRGWMTEAANATMVWAFQNLGIHRLRVAAATDNHPSLGVIRRLGFRFEGIARHAEFIAGRWVDHAVFARLVTD
jgi:ribosomal-protein-serine acetyltransferase